MSWTLGNLAALGFGLAVVLGLPAQAWARKRSKPESTSSPSVRLFRLSSLLIALFLLLWVQGTHISDIGLVLTNPLGLIFATIAAIAAIVGLDIITGAVLLKHPVARARAIQSLAQQAPKGRTASILFVVLTIAAAVWEESTFRGIALHLGMYFYIPTVVIVICSSAAFGIQHIQGGIGAVVYATFFGATFFGMYLLSGSLFPVIAAHCAGNLFVIFRTYPQLVVQEEYSRARSVISSVNIIPL